jgi:ankyrin repeat protein
MTALHWAADRGDSAMAELLLKARANISATTRDAGYTPLHLGEPAASAAVVRSLLKAGADAKAVSASGATVLHLAAQGGNADVVDALLEKGADPNVREPEYGQTPLVFAAEAGRAAAVTALIKHGADVKSHTHRAEPHGPDGRATKPRRVSDRRSYCRSCPRRRAIQFTLSS